ncbi:MAG: Na+ dependent nucleoside transporter N-terminal domain-containing protein, partial [Acidobacteriota bacterium]
MASTPVTNTGGSGWRLSSTELWIIAGGAAVALVAVLLAGFGGVPQAQPVAGAVVILGIAYTLSTNRRAIDLKTVVWGLSLQIVFALVVLKNEW